jgi:glycosyltransferase involved in cell wall biosynthesis
MKLLINTATTFKGGGVQVAKSFMEECKKFQENEYHVILSQNLAALTDRESFPGNFFFYEIDYRPATRVFSMKPRERYFKKLEKKINPDVVFTTSGPAYWRPYASHLIGYNLPHYIYPESPYFRKLSAVNRYKWKLKGMVIRYFYRNDADAYVVQTDDVNRRLKAFINREKIYTVSNTFSDDYLNPKPFKDKLPAKQDGEFRLLSLTAWYPHKNLTIIPEVIDALGSEWGNKVTWVVTLPEDIFNKHFPEKYHKQIRNIGPVKPEEGPSLYSECDALFLPTLLECFSASYAEAMVMEKPVVTSNLSFARSICGDAALYVDPMDPVNIAETIIHLVQEPEIRSRLVAAGSDQVKTFMNARERAEAYIGICKKLAAGRS